MAAFGEKAVGAVFDPLGGGGVGGAAVGWVVLEAAVLGWVVGRGNDDAVREVGGAVAIVGEDGVREGGGGGVAEVLVDHDLHFVGGEDFKGGREGGRGEGVSVLREKEWAGGALVGAELADGLGNGGDVIFVEAGGEGGAAMAGGAEGDALGGVRRVGMEGVEGGEQAGNVHQGFRFWVLAGLVLCGH